MRSNTKERILAAALTLFAQRGYEAVSVAEIAAAVGIRTPSLYKHYAGKRDIFLSAVRRMEQEDAAVTGRFAMPSGSGQASPGWKSVLAFSRNRFAYWTRDPSASAFRRLLTLEQYRDAEMAQLNRQYLTEGPLCYMEQVFAALTDADGEKGTDPARMALEFYAPMHYLMSVFDTAPDPDGVTARLERHFAGFAGHYHLKEETTMEYPRAKAYDTPELRAKIMGPNPVKLEEELMRDNAIAPGAVVCDLGSGQGLTSVFLAREYGFTVYAADLWSDPEDNRRFFDSMGLSEAQIIPVKADATDLPFAPGFFDAVVSTDSYNYFGRDPGYLDRCLASCVKAGGLVYVAIPGMHRDCHDALPPELLLSWTPEQMDYMHDIPYWRGILEQSREFDVLSVTEMESNDEVWADWLAQDNEYARGDRKSMEAGAGRYLNFIKIVLKRK